MIQQFAEAVQREIRKDINTKTDQVASGFCKTFDQYNALCGEIRGLATAEEHLLALAKKVDNDE